MKQLLAKVKRAEIEMQYDKRFLSFSIVVDYEEFGSQNIGGICLDTYDKEKERRVGTAFGCELILRIMTEFDLTKFSDLNGRTIWVLGEGEGYNFAPKGIKPLRVDNYKSNGIIWDEVLKEFPE